MPELIVERLDPQVEMPRYAKEGDSGFDLQVFPNSPQANATGILPGETAILGTRLRFEIPSGYEIQIRPRSGCAKHGLVAQFGTIDEGYRGEVKVILHYQGDAEPYVIEPGERVAQAVLVPVTRANFVERNISEDTERGVSGFGSTGS